MRQLLPILISTFQSVRIIADGLDECNDKDQTSILKEVVALADCRSSTRTCKVMISSRDVDQISRFLSRRVIVSLGKETSALTGAIRGFVRSRVSVLVNNLDESLSQDDASAELEKALLGKADGRLPYRRMGE
jgi:hypothetical protein